MVRNRARRRLKEAARLPLPGLGAAGGDLVRIGRDGAGRRAFAPLIGGLLDLPVLVRLAVLLPVMALSVPVGARLFRVVPDRMYRPFAMGVLLVAGGLALFG